ncbi:MAG TPA: hypothetical protein VN376_00965 [Longilinea sp.]|nr:hypothetical protein [Longilinea sp.]
MEQIKKFTKEEIGKRKRTIDKVKKVIYEITPTWKSDPNVIGIGYGLRSKGGKLGQEIVITFFVEEKEKDPSKIKTMGSKLIPATIRGIPTDVVKFGKMKRHQDEATGNRDETAYEPLVGGVATSNADSHIIFWNGFGTLGSVCFDATTGAAMALSNWHVWAEGGSQGDTIIQPGHPRSEDRVQAYFEAGFCGPLGYIIEWEAPSAITGALYGGAAAAAIAAAASDKIDPTRKGQKNTPTNLGEITRKEDVTVTIDYKTQPIPGTPFELMAKWDYVRHTDQRDLPFHQEELFINEHTLLSKTLRTNKRQYRAGEKIDFYASLKSSKPFPCDYYYPVVYAVPIADQTRKFAVVLHPSICQGEKVCIDFSDDKPNTSLSMEFTRQGATFISPGTDTFSIKDYYLQDGKGELGIIPKSVIVNFPPSRMVQAVIVTQASEVNMAATYQNQNVGNAVSTSQHGVMQTLKVEAEAIDSVMIYGGNNESSILMFCYEPIEQAAQGTMPPVLNHYETTAAHITRKTCCYSGSYHLDPMEQPGLWQAFLFVQNANIVPEGTPPEVAAQMIGGIMQSQNMVDAKEVKESDIECGACALVDFVFEVV